MFEKLKQIWRILFPPKPKPKPKIPPRPQHSIDELVRRGEELKKIHQEQQHEDQLKVCPNCRTTVKVLHTCAKCGWTGCEYCMTYDPVERKYFCEQCWY